MSALRSLRHDRVRSGLIAVLAAVEPCLALTVRGQRDRRWLAPVLEQRKCLHLYHYYEHPVAALTRRCQARSTWGCTREFTRLEMT